MNKLFIPLLIAFIFPISPIKSVEINCNSPVWKNKERCKGKVTKPTKPIVYVYLGEEYSALSEIEEDVSERDIADYKNKKYIASKICEEGSKMMFSYRTRLLRSTKVQEVGCMTPEEIKMAESIRKRKNNATANNLLNQVNYRNFHHMLKRNETMGIRTYQPNYQPYGDAYGTSSQYGAGGYGGYGY